MDTHNIIRNNMHNLHASNNKADLSEILVNSLIIYFWYSFHKHSLQIYKFNFKKSIGRLYEKSRDNINTDSLNKKSIYRAIFF